MPAYRFYLDHPLCSTATLTGEEFTHLSRVMRLRVGDPVELVNGRGTLAQGVVIELSKQSAQIEIHSSTLFPPTQPELTLVQPLLKPASLELIVEKGTELGISAFWFYPAARSLKETLSPNQWKRLQDIAISAFKQCGRLDLPSLKLFSHFPLLDAPLYFGDFEGEKHLSFPDRLYFTSGPEAGFDEKELAFLRKSGIPVRIAPYILRAETAPLAFASRLF